MIDNKEKERISGKVYIEGNTIYWEWRGENVAAIFIPDIVIIGEETTSDGPFLDDWFVVFVTKDGSYKKISWYALNIEELTKYLCENYRSDLNISYLTSSTKFKTVIRYPDNLINQEMIILRPPDGYIEPVSFWDKLMKKIGLGIYSKPWIRKYSDVLLQTVPNARL